MFRGLSNEEGLSGTRDTRNARFKGEIDGKTYPTTFCKNASGNLEPSPIISDVRAAIEKWKGMLKTYIQKSNQEVGSSTTQCSQRNLQDPVFHSKYLSVDISE